MAMSNHRLSHDAAFAMAKALLEITAPCLMEAEKREAFREFYEICRAGLEAYDAQVDRMQRRMQPGKN
jgi:hypothetical protein